MRAIFKEIIKPFFNIICKPLLSNSDIYKAKHPLILEELIIKLIHYKYIIQKNFAMFKI